METWRVVATGAFVLGGLVMVLVGMAQARDRRHSRAADVWRAGLVGLAAVGVVAVLIAYLLPSVAAWGVVAATAIAVVFVTMAD
ncbi:hypothetical protein [Saccharothrix algeriensis]|uniref:Membrane protein n=1 Tax=Saccharothrix algeriensis TaxID=173560 RepID=A0A8T8I410_9PSEU|nr:hypothetical protein [Saccharothrix algeriensis]MBM7811915.1 putative membrane protein [Saccharothrix algeriensis]QTR05623.1 hypothetical protein J7S33_14275 [Saccharothrix algeriensis]